MSVAEISNHRRERQPPHPPQVQGSSPEISAWDNFLRSPHTFIRLPGQKPIRLATDNVRARPAVAPQVSMMIGMTAIGLGVWGTLFPKSVKRSLGISAPTAVVVGAFGARELWSGFSLAGDPTRSDVLWTRVGGDVFDIAVLSALSNPTNPKRGNARMALAAVL